MPAFRTIVTWAFLLAFLRPYLEAFLVTVGEWWFHAAFRINPDKYNRLIIQITTLGRERERVLEIISRIRAYNLPMYHEIWVVVEPQYAAEYPNADRVIVVPREFECLAAAKARALEYSRRVREGEGLSHDQRLKILLLDDDVEPTRNYITTGFVADYDVCQGVTAPRIDYGNHGFKHLLLSHMDDMRFLACLVWCSFTQGVIKRPIYAHGEGLFVTAGAERQVTWNFKIFASEDLVFGQNAAALGLSWSWFHEYIELTSPWSWSDYIKQRRRWLWGNIHAITKPGILPAWGRIIVAGKYLLGFGTFFASVLGIILVLGHVVQVSETMYVLTWGSFAAWIVSFAVSGWVNSGRREHGDFRSPLRFTLNRIWQAFLAVFLAVTLVTPAWTTLALLIALCKGNPNNFEVIAKTRATAALTDGKR